MFLIASYHLLLMKVLRIFMDRTCFRVTMLLLFFSLVFLICLPLLLGWDLHDGRKYIVPPIYFENSLKCAIAVAVPLTLDALWDICLVSSLRPFCIFLLLGVSIPNIIFLSAQMSPAQYFIFFQLRYVICANICYSHLFIYGDPLFRQPPFVAMTILNNLTAILFTWASYLSLRHFKIVVILFYVGFILGCLIFSFYVILWIFKLSKLKSDEISNDDRRSIAYIFSMGIVGVSFIVMIFIYGTYVLTIDMYMYLTTCTYVSLAFMVSVWLLHGRIIRLEIEQSKVRLPLPPL